MRFGVLLESPFVYWGIRIVSEVLFFPSLFFCIVIGKNYGIEHSIFIACIVLLFPGLFLFCSDLFHYVKRKKMSKRTTSLDAHRARGCPFITNMDEEDFVIDVFAKYKGYGDECKTIYFAGFAIFQDEENKENGNLVFQFCFEYSYDTDEYKCYSKHFSDEIVENDFAYFIVENYEQSCRNVKEVLKRRE